MGPALCLELAAYGAEVIADARIPVGPDDPESAKEDAGFVAYICSDLANYLVGQVLPVRDRWAIR